MKTNDKNALCDLTIFIKDIGDILLNKYGKKQFYLPEQVTETHAESIWEEDEDMGNLARATYCTFSNFENYSLKSKPPLNYGEIRDAIFLTLSKTLTVQEIEKYGLPIEPGNYPNKYNKGDYSHLSDTLSVISEIFR